MLAAEAADRADDLLPTASLEMLRLRAELLRRLRGFFDERGFLEVETPILSADTVVDRHLDPFATGICGELGKPPRRLWLQTSPEFHMKRLLAAGAGPIYQVSRVFRLGERGRLHNPEFTLVEWYQPGEDMAAGMRFTNELCQALLGCERAEELSYATAFARHVGVDPHRASGAELAQAARRLGIAAPTSLSEEDRDGWIDLLLSHCVQPHLGAERPTLLFDYPAGQAALARVRPCDPPVAERFELFFRGIELANGYHELLDAEELERRNERANALRAADGKNTLPEGSRLLKVMQKGLPPAVGVAMGFDRVAMLAAGAASIDEVIAFPLERA
ncbi:MAG: EF-P lysine aminoacylase EpmA [Planctomycetota bacterium]